MTGRFIYDYDKGCDVPYHYEFIIDDEDKIQAEVFDASSPATLSFKRFDFAKHKTDLYVLVFSISESKSFLYIRKLLEHFVSLKEKGTVVEPIAILANKSDTSHFREVSSADVSQLLDQFRTKLRMKYFDELSVAREDVRRIFLEMYDWSRDKTSTESSRQESFEEADLLR